MKNFNIVAVFFMFFSAHLTKAQIIYPKTIKKPVTNTYHNIEIIDDYQWLEELETPQVKDWVKEQNKISVKYALSNESAV